ncbi:MAG: nucleotidyl transferase AbiEii/AbiGii toxin family protein [Bacteroidales bacterium]|nr:nucleotidyl transferase AbiEii/AbiGii toxin family protein [Bacteroidales bacterium]
MVEECALRNGEDKLLAQREVMQKIVLAGLARGGFFDHAAFYGGTCLRIFHHLNRFSEDMDFSLKEKNTDVHLEQYFSYIIDEFKYAGFPVEIVKREKKTFGRVESASLKEDTEIYDIKFQTRKMMKVKIELDTDPPLGFQTELRRLELPYSFSMCCFTLPCLYAGKMHALAFRNWKTRVKGRDWYDFEWYVRNEVPLNYPHLQARILEFNGEKFEQADFVALLRERFSQTDIAQVKRDVAPFLMNPKELDAWSNEYFVELLDRVKFETN